ncbi:MAG: YceI family protein [Acidimicrobiia bacterium]
MPVSRRSLRWIIAAVVGVLLVVVGGPFVYINFIKEDAPDKLTFADAAATTVPGATAGATTASSGTTTGAGATTAPSAAGATTAAPSGTGEAWNISTGTQVGYRVKEVLFGQSTEGVGRTSSVKGSLRLDGTTVTSVDVTVDMTTVKSDESRRDGQFNGSIMAVSQFPTATFKLTRPIALGSLPADGTEIKATGTGDLTLRGTTKTVDIALTARRANGQIQVLGSYDVKFSDWKIPAPSAPGITTEDHGLLELLLVFAKA